jgi:hypothetical protein
MKRDRREKEYKRGERRRREEKEREKKEKGRISLYIARLEYLSSWSGRNHKTSSVRWILYIVLVLFVSIIFLSFLSQSMTCSLTQ